MRDAHAPSGILNVCYRHPYNLYDTQHSTFVIMLTSYPPTPRIPWFGRTHDSWLHSSWALPLTFPLILAFFPTSTLPFPRVLFPRLELSAHYSFPSAPRLPFPVSTSFLPRSQLARCPQSPLFAYRGVLTIVFHGFALYA